ncbi:amino acid permease [Scopulibacillus cellulosilyticus]|uniref:Amino acid permease n=1 Tax=Scopulibacillus cellulosilyticus TaxID=2665665 RepID=A0ABW2PRJ9_9BACL
MNKSDNLLDETFHDKNNGKNNLKRGLRSRHMSMIAIGGAIGTGLFVGSGETIHGAGPGGALLAYAIIGVMVYFIMTSLGEMTTLIPVAGAFETYPRRFVDPALGFAFGWNYWYNWATTIPAELAAGTLVIKYWFPNTPTLLWSILFLALIFGLNILSAKGYGESEFWFAGIKVVTIIVFLIMGVAMIFGILGGHAVGTKNFMQGGTPFHGGLLGLLAVFMVVRFSFGGTELIGVAAGESENPAKDIPKAIRSVFWRILLFYILAIFVIGMLIPYTDPNLLKSGVNNIAVSPFTLVFKRSGLAFAASVMNAVILTSVLSAGNSSLYASTRTLFALAKSGNAPRLFAKVNKRGVPTNALYLTTAFGFLAFLSSFFGNGVVYNWLLNASGLSGLIAWSGIAISHYRFRKAYIAQGKDLKDLPYRAKWYPFGPIFSFVVCLVIIVGQGYTSFIGSSVNWQGLLVSYIGLPLFILTWLIYKFVKKTKVVPLKECDFGYNE